MNLRALMIGLLVGVLATGGLFIGTRILLSTTMDEALSARDRWWRYGLGSLVLVGQFLVAMAILSRNSEVCTEPLSLGLGMIGSIFATALIMNLATRGGGGGSNN